MPFMRASAWLNVAATPLVCVIPTDGTLVMVPGGPSERRSDGIPSRGIPGRNPAWYWLVAAGSGAPDSSVSFSSSVIWPMSASTLESPVAADAGGLAPTSASPSARTAINAVHRIVIARTAHHPSESAGTLSCHNSVRPRRSSAIHGLLLLTGTRTRGAPRTAVVLRQPGRPQMEISSFDLPSEEAASQRSVVMFDS